jgi:hypothetical protein
MRWMTWRATNLLAVFEGIAYELGNNIEFIVHMAAETHVDNSISDPVPFIRNNVESTISLLEYTRGLIRSGCDLKAFFYVSTDEVFGPALGTTMFDEWDRHKPTNPYSSSKSAAENICIAYENTYKIPLMIVNVMNAFGERQHPEKFIPKCIKKVMDGEKAGLPPPPSSPPPPPSLPSLPSPPPPPPPFRTCCLLMVYLYTSTSCSSLLLLLRGDVSSSHRSPCHPPHCRRSSV